MENLNCSAREMNMCGTNQTNTKPSIIWMLLLGVFLSGFFIPGQQVAYADTHIYVDAVNGINAPETTGDENSPFQTITLAMALAEQRGLEEPWIVHVKAGQYDENSSKPGSQREIFPIKLRNGMTLIGDDGPEECIISGFFSSNTQVPLVQGTDLTGVTIQGLHFRDNHRIGDVQGGAIQLNGEFSGNIKQCYFTNNYVCDGGGGISFEDNFYGNITGCVFINNSSGGCHQGGGGAIKGNQSIYGNIAHNTFIDNRTVSNEGGGALGVYLSFHGEISNNLFSGNSSGGGGAFKITGGMEGKITDNIIVNNSAPYGSAFSIHTNMQPITSVNFTVSGNIISANRSTNNSISYADMYIQGGSAASGVPVISDNYFLDNPQDFADPAELCINIPARVINNTFYDTTGQNTAIYNYSDTTIIRNNIFAGQLNAIYLPGEYNPTITDNDFDVATTANMLHRSGQPRGNDIWYLDINIDGCDNNHDWIPDFVGEDQDNGEWSELPVYDMEANLTAFTDADKNWNENEWAGVMLNVSSDPDNRRHLPITGNTATQLFIRGNLVPIGFTIGQSYTLDDYHLAPGSANINSGADTGLSHDFEGDDRPLWGAYDIGADEYVPGEVTIHTISATTGSNGSITPNGQTHIHEGRDRTFFILADGGYFIEDVLIDGEPVGPTSQYTFEFILEDHTIEASFVENSEQITITASAGRGGTISPPGNTSVPVEGTQTFNIIPDNDYEIADVLVDNISMGDVTEYTFSDVSANNTIYATFNYIGDTPTSEINIQLNSSGITLGEWIKITGNISPPPTLGGAFVDIAMIPSSGVTIHRTVLANSLGDFSYDLQCDDITASGSWTIQASWKGDYIIQGDTSTGQTLTVTKAQSTLILDTSSLVRKFNDPVPFIGGIFTPDPRCGANLSGIPVEIEITGPNDETDLQTVFTNDKWGHFSLLNYSGLNALGAWTLRAVFDGNDSYEAVTSTQMTIQVVETAGYAIIVQGKLANEEGLASHNKTCNLVYKTLLGRGLLDDDIFYFNYDIDQTDIEVNVDTSPTWNGIRDAVTIWAKDKMNAKPANLFIVMIDHGFDEEFHIDPDAVITSINLDDWQTTLQSNLTGDAVSQEIISILGFCRSGSFIDELSGPNRVIITSAAEGESSYKGPLDQDTVREGEYFVSELFKAASFGKSIKQCFEEALSLTEAFTSSDKIPSSNPPFGDNSRQHPLLEDTADGIGGNDLDESGDGDFSDTLFFGITPATANDPGDVAVTAVTPTLFLDETQNHAMFWARVNDNPRVAYIWAEIKTPGHDPIDPRGTGQATMDLVTIPLAQYNSALDYYEPGAAPDVFTEPGIYYIYYFAKDSLTGQVSALKQSAIYKNKSGNKVPDAFHLLYPRSDDDPVLRTTGFMLGWQTTVDPDGDAVTYTVNIVNDPTDPRWGTAQVFDYTLENLTSGMVFIGEDALFIQKRRYLWQVTAIDQYGAARVSIETDWTFEIDNDNAINGWISGGVYGNTNSTIVHASVSVQGFAVEMLTDNSGLPTGYYLGSGHPGTYTLTAGATGYQTNNRQIILLNGGFTTGDIVLTGLAIPGDFNGDGQVDNDDIEVLGLGFGDSDCSAEDPCSADADEDGDVDGQDMIQLINAL